MTILIAEDDPITREAIEASLSGEGFTTVVTSDGEEAIESWRSTQPDLVCLDVMMPKMDGYEVCRRIRKVDPHLPILFLSAKNEEIDVVVGLELGADDFVRKPFGKHELIARVRSAIRRAEAHSVSKPGHFSFAGWTIYPGQLRAENKSGTEETDLSPREVKLLSILHERIGEAVSRDDLLELCWGLDYFPESRTLDQHIAKLRKKIEVDPAKPELIETVRGVGYRLRRFAH